MNEQDYSLPFQDDQDRDAERRYWEREAARERMAEGWSEWDGEEEEGDGDE